MIGLISMDGVENIALDDSLYSVAAIQILRRNAISMSSMMIMNTVQSRADHLKKLTFLFKESAAFSGSSSDSSSSVYAK